MPVYDRRGFHPILEKDHPHLFIDTCMQAWPDADYGNAHRHGCTAYCVTAWHPNKPTHIAVEDLMTWHHVARNNPNLSVAVSASDIRAAKERGDAVFILTAQDGDFIGNKLHRLEAFYRLGLRIMLPVYNSTNLIGDGCLDITDRGLTRFGKLVVEESNRLGLLLDGTHVGKRTTMDMMAASEAPVIFSHSNPTALFESPRNIDDEQIKACAEKGGVIGVVPWGPLVFRTGADNRPTLRDLVDAVDYIADLTGSVQNIGIGTDFSLGTYGTHEPDLWGKPVSLDPVIAPYAKHVRADLNAHESFVAGFSSYPEITRVIEELETRNYSTSDISSILGGNFLRVFEEVWKEVDNG